MLSFEQLARLAAAAGFSDPVTAAAIALAESRGNSNAHNPVPPDNSYGLWQINMLGNLGSSRRAQLGLNSNNDLFDPATNARAAYAIYQQQGWRAWSTYLNGAYRRFLQSWNGNDPPLLDIGNVGNVDIPITFDDTSTPSQSSIAPVLLIGLTGLLLYLIVE